MSKNKLLSPTQKGFRNNVSVFSDISVQVIATDKGRYDLLSTSVDPLIKKLANREPRILAGTGWSAFQHRD
jgi:hypothetical protein